MKSDSRTSILLGLLAVLALANIVLCFLYGSNIATVRKLQPTLPQIQNNRAYASALAMDVGEYSKSHPDILPILESAMKKVLPPAAQPKSSAK